MNVAIILAAMFPLFCVQRGAISVMSHKFTMYRRRRLKELPRFRLRGLLASSLVVVR